MTVMLDQVSRQMVKLQTGRALGSDGFSLRVLKSCEAQLFIILLDIFILSLLQENVPLVVPFGTMQWWGVLEMDTSQSSGS